MSKKEEKSLQELTEQWMAMERKTFAQRRRAEEYYEKHLMQLIIESYKEKNADQVFEQVDYLILSVGTSYEPLILNISLLNPQKILFLYTSETEEILEKIVNYLKLEATHYQKCRVEATDPLSIYHEIKRIYLQWDKPEKLYIDFTGGTKIMSAAAALAGSLINVQLIYVGTEHYLVDFRKPEPGSEELFYIDNPVEVFGDLELEKVFALIERCNYAGAAEKLEILKDKIPDPLHRQELNFVYLLVRIYEHWDALEFKPAKMMMEQLLMELRRDYRMHKKILMMDFQPILNNQYKLLCQLNKIPDLIKERQQEQILRNKAIVTALAFTIFENAKRREEQEKYDMATLLWYRLLEIIEQRRLMVYQLFASAPEYREMDFSSASGEYQGLFDEEQCELLKRKNSELKQQIFRRNDRDYLPRPIALLDGYLLLAALGDRIMGGADGNCINLLKRIRSMVSLRNNSIFAHGLGPVGKEDYLKFRNFVVEMFSTFCEAEEVEAQRYEMASRFLNPLSSRYYTMMEDEG